MSARTIKDARGIALPVGGYRRVVSLVPSVTETLVELGLGERLVGRTRFCVHPSPQVDALPAVGGTKTLDLEAIAALEPDLVIACREENRREDVEDLEGSGLAVHLIDPRDLDGVRRFLADLGALLELKGPVEALLAELDAARRRARDFAAALRAAGGAPRTLCLIWRRPWMAAGHDCYIDGVMRELGLVNTAPDSGRYPALGDADLAALAPTLLLLPSEPYAFEARHARELVDLGVAPDAAACLLVPGEDLSWYGSRSPRALDALRGLLAERLGLETAP